MNNIIDNCPMVTIIMCTYNGSKYLEEQLDSLKNQTYENIKVLIYDDISNDGTSEIVNNYIEKYSLNDKFFFQVNNKNLGASENFMIALKKNSKEKYIFFCDQDDVWDKSKVSKMITAMLNAEKDNKDTPVIVCHNSIVTNSKNEEIRRYEIGDVSFGHMIFNPQMQGCCMLINESVVKIAVEKKLYVLMHDWYLSLVVALSGKIIKLDDYLLRYRQHENNVVGFEKISFFKRIWLLIASYEKKQRHWNAVKQLLSVSETFPKCSPLCDLKKYIDEKNKKGVIRVLSEYNAFDKGLRGKHQKHLIKKGLKHNVK